MTRSKERLYLSYSDKPSPFIKDINRRYLRLNPQSSIKVFYPVSLEDYYFADWIVDIYSSEEETRQWVIRELMDTYGYPPELLQVEYQVANFSRTGFVDVAVLISHRGKMVPFILIETKAPGKGLGSGLEQLKSYMEHCRTCRYGMATDGNELVVLNRNLEPVEDIPEFHPAMRSSGGQAYRFYDFRKNAQVDFIKSPDTPNHIMVENGDQRLEYLDPDVEQYPVFDYISAGNFSLMNEKAENAFSLPAAWFEGRGNIFLLKVRGDSMIDAGIQENDLVVVEQSRKAQNRDIVVVGINEEATLKRYSLMGNTVLLIPENEKYEPIQVNTEQACILGVVWEW